MFQIVHHSGSTNENISEYSEQLLNIPEGNNMNNKEVSKDVSAVSVSEEIKRLQQKINTVSVENVKFPSWKSLRSVVRLHSASVDSLIDNPPDLPPRARRKFGSQESILAPQLPPKKRNVPNNSSQPKSEGISTHNFVSKIPRRQPKHSLNRSRQIQPISYIAPAAPPPAVDDDLTSSKDTDGQHTRHEEYVPVLPSVKKLANKFQVMQENVSRQIILTKVRLEM